ncbi:hypothetical protein Tco_1200477 [Tanacetum coccineum]
MEEDLLVTIEKHLVLEMIVDESLEMLVDETLEMIEDESLDMNVDETLKLDDILSRLSDVVVARMKSIKDEVNARTIKFMSDKEIIVEVTKSTNREHESGVGSRQDVADKESWKKAAEEASQQADLAKQQAELAKQRSELANERFARDCFCSHSRPLFRPNRYYKVMNLGSSRIPNDDEDGDDQDGNDEDGNGNNEDGNGSDESSSASDEE